MEWEFTSNEPLTVHTLREILDTLPGATPICIVTANEWDSDPVTRVDFNLAVRSGPHWAHNTSDAEVEKVAVLTLRA